MARAPSGMRRMVRVVVAAAAAEALLRARAEPHWEETVDFMVAVAPVAARAHSDNILTAEMALKELLLSLITALLAYNT